MTNIFIKQVKNFRANVGVLSAALCVLLVQPAWAENILKDVKASNLANGDTAITLQFAQPIGDIKAFNTDSPPRIALDLPETNNAFAQKKLLLSSGLAKSVNTYESAGRTRVLVDLNGSVQYHTKAVGNTLVLTLDKQPAVAKAVDVSSVDFKRTGQGAGQLVVKFGSEGAIASMRENGSQIIVDLPNANVADALIQNLEVAQKATPVVSVSTKRLLGKTQLILTTKGNAQALAYQTGNEYVLEISPAAVQSTSKMGKNIGAVSNGKKTVGYGGKPVTFNFQDVPVRTVLQLIAEESNLNIVASDTVGGNVTLRLVNVPWDQALEIVLRAKGLDKRRDGNVVWIAPQAELASFEQAKEDARIALENREETVTEYIAVNYGNAEAIAKALTEGPKTSGGGGGGSNQQQNSFLSPRGSIGFDSRTNTLLVVDIPKKIVNIKKLLATIDRPVDQVIIEARIVVAQDSFARDLGSKFGLNDRYGLDPLNLGKTTDSGFNSTLGISNPAGILNFNILGKNSSLDLELQAMESTGRGEVVSNPRIITSNQKSAIIRQGDEVGYVTTQASGTSTVPQATVQFKEVLLELKVLPTITQDGRVYLDVVVKKDEVKSFLSTPTGSIPQIQKREVSTAVLIEDGQTVVIGGVYEFKNRDDVSKVPFLGDIPFFGNFFKKTGKSKEKAELLIFLTPRILKPAMPAQ